MFTGLVQSVGAIEAIEPTSAGRRLRLATAWDHQAAPGDSIAVAGCCLTVVEAAGSALAFDVIPETLARTTLGARGPGDKVNLEPALRASDAMGGHNVQGHIDGVGEVVAVETTGEWRVRIAAPAAVMELVTPKGSIAVEGVSLTVAACNKQTFDVALIPETLERTTLGALKPGDRVNLETDILARTIIHWLRNWSQAAGGGSQAGG
ncbi:MAG: riboflavin synthase [Phycisphaerales bacterium JB039]